MCFMMFVSFYFHLQKPKISAECMWYVRVCVCVCVCVCVFK